MAKDIPGFHFDEEKGKYFRIQQNHKVVPGTGYTIQFIKEAQAAKQDQRRAQLQTSRKQAGKIIRSPLLSNTTSPLAKRLGSSKQQNKDDILKQYGSGLSRCIVDAPRLGRQHGQFAGSMFSITRSGILCATHKPRSVGEYEPLLSNITPVAGLSDSIDLPFRSIANCYNQIARLADLIVSLYCSNGEERAVVSSDGSSQFTVRPFNAEGQLETYFSIEWNLANRRVETIWDIAAAPSSPHVAIATDQGLIVGHCQLGDFSSISFSATSELKAKEQMNASFKNSNIVMSGERSGRINFTDLRAGRSIARLLHSSAVLATLPLYDPNIVLAHGYSTTCTYDLRYVQQTPISRKARFTNQSKHSKACINFAMPPNRHSDHYTRGRKLAYSSDLDLIAAASTNAHTSGFRGFVTLYSARTGRVIDSPLTRHRYNDDVTSVDIRRVRDGPESVFCLSGPSLEEWGHGRLSWDDMDFYGIDYTKVVGQCVGGGLSFEQEWERGNSIRWDGQF